MSSEDTMKIAAAEAQKAADLRASADNVMKTAQQQADGMMQDADEHQRQSANADAKAKQELEQERKDAERERDEAEKELQKEKSGGLFG